MYVDKEPSKTQWRSLYEAAIEFKRLNLGKYYMIQILSVLKIQWIRRGVIAQ